jgi:hypothetical protein
MKEYRISRTDVTKEAYLPLLEWFLDHAPKLKLKFGGVDSSLGTIVEGDKLVESVEREIADVKEDQRGRYTIRFTVLFKDEAVMTKFMLLYGRDLQS